MRPITSLSWPRRFARGFAYPFRGLGFIARNPRLLPWVLLPIAVTLGLLVGAAFLTLAGTPWLVDQLWARPAGGLLLTSWWILAVGLGLALFAVSMVVLYATAGLIGTPFYDRLSQRVEDTVRGPADEPFSWRVFLGDVWQSVSHTLIALILWLVVMGALLLLNVVPVVGSALEFVLSVAFTALFLSREMMDGAMSRRRLSFRRKLGVVLGNLALMEGFGLAAAMLLWVPLLNFVSMPVAIVGGTLMLLDLEDEGVIGPTPRRALPAPQPGDEWSPGEPPRSEALVGDHQLPEVVL